MHCLAAARRRMTLAPAAALLLALGPATFGVQARRAFAPRSVPRPLSASTPSPLEHTIDETLITVEAAAGSDSGEHGSGASGGASTASAGEAFSDVQAVDTFARGKVANFLRRRSGGAAGGPSAPSDGSGPGALRFDTAEENAAAAALGGRGRVFRARLRLPLDGGGGVKIAQGVAETAKDAELLAAMHAERILDAAGVALYQLPSMQRRHADAARKAGRWAPMPGETAADAPFASGAPLPMPLPLRMVGSALRGDGGAVTAVVTDAALLPEVATAVDGAAAGSSATTEAVAPRRSDTAATPRARSSGSSTVSHAPTTAAPAPVASALPSGHHSGSFSDVPGSSLFDPTENGAWQMCNLHSVRLSPSADCLQLAYIFDPASLRRVRECFASGGGGAGAGGTLESRLAVSHVLVPGIAQRFFLAEIRVGDGLYAKGKAADREFAVMLAAMHCELLMDHAGLPLFPADPARQATHAALAAGYGRWAVDATQPADTPGARQPPQSLAAAPPPLPLKQTMGGDDALAGSAAPAHRRSASEDLVSRHTELAATVGGYLEVNPPQPMLDEARAVLRGLLHFHRSPHPELLVCTRMGDAVRATVALDAVLPPAVFGGRCGTAIGKSAAHAEALASLHALDIVASVGAPSHPGDAAANAAFAARRAALGLVTADDRRYLRRPGVGGCPRRVPVLPGYLADGGATRPLPHAAVVERLLFMSLDQFVTAAPPEGSSLLPVAAATFSGATPAAVAPAVAPLTTTPTPTPTPTATATAASPAVPAATASASAAAASATAAASLEAALLNAGLEKKANVQAYCRRREGHEPVAVVLSTGKNDAMCAAYNLVALPLLLPERLWRQGETSSDGYGDGCDGTGAVTAGDDSAVLPRRLIAVGASLKKKDADRCCYLHADLLLRACGVDPILEGTAMGDRQRQRQQQQQKEQQEVGKTETAGSDADAETAETVPVSDGGAPPTAGASLPETAAAPLLRLPPPLMHPLLRHYLANNNVHTSNPGTAASRSAAPSAWRRR